MAQNTVISTNPAPVDEQQSIKLLAFLQELFNPQNLANKAELLASGAQEFGNEIFGVISELASGAKSGIQDLTSSIFPSTSRIPEGFTQPDFAPGVIQDAIVNPVKEVAGNIGDFFSSARHPLDPATASGSINKEEIIAELQKRGALPEGFTGGGDDTITGTLQGVGPLGPGGIQPTGKPTTIDSIIDSISNFFGSGAPAGVGPGAAQLALKDTPVVPGPATFFGGGTISAAAGIDPSILAGKIPEVVPNDLTPPLVPGPKALIPAAAAPDPSVVQNINLGGGAFPTFEGTAPQVTTPDFSSIIASLRDTAPLARPDAPEFLEKAVSILGAASSAAAQGGTAGQVFAGAAGAGLSAASFGARRERETQADFDRRQDQRNFQIDQQIAQIGIQQISAEAAATGDNAKLKSIQEFKEFQIKRQKFEAGKGSIKSLGNGDFIVTTVDKDGKETARIERAPDDVKVLRKEIAEFKLEEAKVALERTKLQMIELEKITKRGKITAATTLAYGKEAAILALTDYGVGSLNPQELNGMSLKEIERVILNLTQGNPTARKELIALREKNMLILFNERGNVEKSTAKKDETVKPTPEAITQRPALAALPPNIGLATQLLNALSGGSQ